MKTLYKITLILFLLPLISFANDKDKYTKNKIIKKEYTVSSNANLNIANKYGNIEINTWDQDKVEIVVSITTNGNDEEKVQKRLDQIKIEFDATTSVVSAKTIIGKSSSNWSFWKNSNNVNMEINYFIKAPKTNNINLSNDYGDIIIDKLEGSATINCDYGKLIIGELMNTENHINIDYAPNSTIEYVNEAKINADYSKLTIEKANAIDLNSDYSTNTYEDVKHLDFNCDYGSVEVENAGTIVGNSDYLTIKIGSLHKSFVLKAGYGAVKIENLKNGFETIDINADYTGVKIGIDRNTPFNFKATYSYGNLKSDNLELNFTVKDSKTTSKYYEGYNINNTSNSNIKIKSTYGGTTLKAF